MDQKRHLISTSDGSHTLFVPSLNETYHSQHGSVTESLHVFIKNGLEQLVECNTINVIEIGFGTGLNVWLTWLWANQRQKNIRYTAYEKYPLLPNEYQILNYGSLTGSEAEPTAFMRLHESPWGQDVAIAKHLILKKIEADFNEAVFPDNQHLVYFDAFAPDKQPHLWNVPLFAKLFEALQLGGILVTYSAKGEVRRKLQSVGFNVERAPGPPGKREMLVARK